MLSRSRIAELVPQLVLLSAVTSVALNTTMQQRWSRIRDYEHAQQMDVLRGVNAELDKGRRRPPAHELARQLVRVGLRPSDFGFTSTEALEIERAMSAWHRPLTWYEALFTGKKPFDPDAAFQKEEEITDQGACRLTDVEQFLSKLDKHDINGR